MAQLGFTASADNAPEIQNDFAPLPAGWYTATISSAELTTTKAGTGEYIKIRYDITGPSHQGRVVFDNVNIRNPNPVAEKIGREDLERLRLAIGISALSDTDQLIGGNVDIKLTVKKSEEWGESNEVKGIKAGGGGSAAPAPGAAPAAAAKPAGRPW